MMRLRFLSNRRKLVRGRALLGGTSLIRNTSPVGTYSSPTMNPGVWVFLMSEVPLYWQGRVKNPCGRGGGVYRGTSFVRTRRACFVRFWIKKKQKAVIFREFLNDYETESGHFRYA